ncbi:MAG: lysylphosphatidylglycerol synthase domain-containing protein, partial [Myxococcota bacterium]
MSSAPSRPGVSIGLLVKALAALLISAVAFWFAFHNVDLDQVGTLLSKSSPAILLLFLLSQLANHLLRTFRWGLLVRPLGPAS